MNAAAAAPTDVRALLEAAPLSRAQKLALTLIMLLIALDGYDVLAISFAAPGIVADWGVGPGALGLVFSAGLAGMALGSLLLAPVADSIGRRALILVALVLLALGMGASAFAGSVTELATWRVVTGIGIGAMISVGVPLGAEFANARRRPLAIAFCAIGYPLGGTVGGLAAAALMRLYGWPAVFLLGAGAALVLLPVIWWLLPESPAYLLECDRPDRLDRVNRSLARLDHPPVAALPPRTARTGPAYGAIFAAGQRRDTLRIMLINLLIVTSIYYVLSWMPQLVAERGFSPSSATLTASIASCAGILAALFVGLAGQHVRIRLLAATMATGVGLSTLLFALMPADFVLIAVMAALVGACVHGCMAGLYSLIAATFSPTMRATGVGFVVGIGRGGSTIAPALAGGLFALGLDRVGVSAALGSAAVLAGLLLFFTRGRGQESGG